MMQSLLKHAFRSLFFSTGCFSLLSQVAKERFFPVVMWISAKDRIINNMTFSSHRYGELEFFLGNNMYTASGMLSSFSFNILPGSACYSLSSAHGDGLSLFEISSNSMFTIITRDAFGNIRTEHLENSVVSIIYDSSSNSNVMLSIFDAAFAGVSVSLGADISSGYCNHHVGALIGMLAGFVLIQLCDICCLVSIVHIRCSFCIVCFFFFPSSLTNPFFQFRKFGRHITAAAH
jgi:hypothetical protein